MLLVPWPEVAPQLALQRYHQLLPRLVLWHVLLPRALPETRRHCKHATLQLVPRLVARHRHHHHHELFLRHHHQLLPWLVLQLVPQRRRIEGQRGQGRASFSDEQGRCDGGNSAR